MNCATKPSQTQRYIWAIWLIVFLVTFLSPGMIMDDCYSASLLGVTMQEGGDGVRKPWESYHRRWKKWALRRYRAWQEAHCRAQQAAWMARLALKGLMPMAWLAECVTKNQLSYQLGALPVLYALLETLKVRTIINRYCPSQGEVDHGAVALVLILNRLMFPLPLYRVADWVGQTVLGVVLGVPAAKFNDDRLERTLDALAPHLEAIWLRVVGVALQKADVDLSVLFYDLTAFIVHGRHADSELVDFGFAHNTPSDKRKFKLALNTIADGNLPGLYRLWSGRASDQATVQKNMENLKRWLASCKQPQSRTLVVGDRAMLNAEIALAYEQADNLLYLAGLAVQKPEHLALLSAWSDAQFEDYPIVSGPNPQYWGRGCSVTLTHEGRSVTQRGLVVVTGILRDQLRQKRQHQLQEMEKELSQVRADIGKPRLRSLKALQRRVNSRLRSSPVKHLIETQVYTNPQGQLNLTWQINSALLAQQERLDGRYLLVTNDWSRSHSELFQLYRGKDGGEKRFLIAKNDLQVSPIFLHKDNRIAAMLLINMLALLTYSLLERQMRQHSLQLTTRQLILRLENLTLIETHFYDGSLMRRITPLTPESLAILPLVQAALESLIEQTAPSRPPPLLSAPPHPLLLPCPQ